MSAAHGRVAQLGRAMLVLMLSSVVAVPARAQDVKARVGRAKHALDRAAEERQTRRATERFDPIFKKYTKRYFGVGTDWHWFKAQGMAESDLTPGA